MWKVISAIVSKVFKGLFNHAADISVEFFTLQFETLKISADQFLANELDPSTESYYDKFGGSDAVIEWLKTVDRNPDDDVLDLVKYATEGMEIFAIKMVAPRGYRTLIKQLRKQVQSA